MNCIQRKMRYIVPLHKLIMDFTFSMVLHNISSVYLTDFHNFISDPNLLKVSPLYSNFTYILAEVWFEETYLGGKPNFRCIFFRICGQGKNFGMEAFNGAIKSLRSCCRGNSYLFLSSNVFDIQNGDIGGGHQQLGKSLIICNFSVSAPPCNFSYTCLELLKSISTTINTGFVSNS